MGGPIGRLRVLLVGHLTVGHLTLVIFVVLAVAMALLTLTAVQDVPLEGTQRIWLVIAAVLLAGLSAWIISRV